MSRASDYNKKNLVNWGTSAFPWEVVGKFVDWARFTDDVTAEQQRLGLMVDGMLGPKTVEALTSAPGEPPWYHVAMGEVGTKEFQPGSNPQIEKYHASTSIGSSPDDVPWCSSFVNWCMEQAGIKGTVSAWARSWLNWGEELTIPRLGCIVVLARGSGGHVGFYRGSGDLGKIEVLGGNQSNQVRFSFYNRGDILGYRWPKNYQK